jgi:hypothetical protein
MSYVSLVRGPWPMGMLDVAATGHECYMSAYVRHG